MCDKTVDLCEDGSTCAGLKQIFMSLCYHENEMMTQCTSDCAFLLNQLEREAEKQGRAIECVEYIQPDLPSKCSTAHNPEEEQSSSSTEPLISCPSENEYTKDLHAGEFETISCTDLYPSGIFGTGSTYRYCMIGGGGAVDTIKKGMQLIPTFTIYPLNFSNPLVDNYEIYQGYQISLP